MGPAATGDDDDHDHEEQDEAREARESAAERMWLPRWRLRDVLPEGGVAVTHLEKIEQAAAAVENFESAIRAARATSEPSELLRRLHKALFRAQSKYAELTGLIRPPSSRQDESVK